MNEYDGNWICTYTGKTFHLLLPRQEEICIEDIAHQLSLLCRFNGCCRQFYSVAEHSIRVSNIVPDRLKLSALLHDAHEAYVGDMTRPLKQTFPVYKDISNNIQVVIDDKFGTNIYQPEIKYADNVLLSTEKRDLMMVQDEWAELPPPLPQVIYTMQPAMAEQMFLLEFYRLRN